MFLAHKPKALYADRAVAGQRSASLLAILVDDGPATGLSARAALRALREGGAQRLILARPIAVFGAVESSAKGESR